MTQDAAHAAGVVSLKFVDKTFPNGTAALSDFNLDIETGEFVSLLGASGSGKSTVLRLVAGLDAPTAGEVSVFGTEPVEARRSGRLAYVFQEATLLPWASVRKNVALPLRLAKRSRKEIDTAVDHALDVVGLADRGDDLPRHLSGGMRMRVSIARALTLEPTLLLMDEPFGALDEITRQSLQNEIKEIWQKSPGLSVIFVTHNVFEASFLATRVVVLGSRPGRVVADIPNRVGALAADEVRRSAEFSASVNRISEALENHADKRAA